MDNNYTLNNSIFRYGLEIGPEGEEIFDDKKIMVVGGAATQLVMKDNPHLLRPTTDIDFIVNSSTSKTERKLWARHLETIALNDGYLAEGKLSRFGSEMRFKNLASDFILHLDCFGPSFFQKNKKRFDGEYERAEIVCLEEKEIRYHSPSDIILNKIRRLDSLFKSGVINLNSLQKEIVNLVKNPGFDYLKIGNLEDELVKLLKIRNQTVEDLGRLGYGNIIEEIENYKVQKDIYDICGIIQSCREKKIQINPKEFKKSWELFIH